MSRKTSFDAMLSVKIVCFTWTTKVFSQSVSDRLHRRNSIQSLNRWQEVGLYLTGLVFPYQVLHSLHLGCIMLQDLTTKCYRADAVCSCSFPFNLQSSVSHCFVSAACSARTEKTVLSQAVRTEWRHFVLAVCSGHIIWQNFNILEWVFKYCTLMTVSFNPPVPVFGSGSVSLCLLWLHPLISLAPPTHLACSTHSSLSRCCDVEF